MTNLDNYRLLWYYKVTMAKVIKISDEVVRKLEALRHLGQSYDGVIKELLAELEKKEKK